jgi:hypothetical protein
VQAICIARHRFLSEHVCSLFGEMSIETFPAVGFSAGMEEARRRRPEVVFCDYDLLASVSLQEWATDPVLQETPIIAVSLTRRHDEVQLYDGNGAAGFLYLPTLTKGDAAAIVRAVTKRIIPPRDVLQWEGEPRAEQSRVE